MTFAIALLVAGCRETGLSVEEPVVDVRINDRAFELELALDSPSRYQGLSDREWIAPDGGMLFVFPDADKRAFVMRRCHVPIDLLYLDAGGRIVSMHRMQVEPSDTPEAQLKRYASGWPAQFVIEFAGSTLDELGLKTGEKIDLPYDSLKRRAR
jgi:uncharacterized membrane protein (UPF0127 family)